MKKKGVEEKEGGSKLLTLDLESEK
jgi:hypothetical protein